MENKDNLRNRRCSGSIESNACGICQGIQRARVCYSFWNRPKALSSPYEEEFGDSSHRLDRDTYQPRVPQNPGQTSSALEATRGFRVQDYYRLALQKAHP